jgi:hypothetical protein
VGFRVALTYEKLHKAGGKVHKCSSAQMGVTAMRASISCGSNMQTLQMLLPNVENTMWQE